ncbi:tail length tape measure protein [Xanthomonas phage NEB7]|nr:tail length tape measure protein [Xanthomonas phage NEB7]
MASTVVDELVVRLTLQADSYEDAEKKVETNAKNTERKVRERTDAQTKRDKDQMRRLRDNGASVKAFAATVLTAVTVMGGLAVAAGGALTNLLGFETGLRRQAVGTSLSNREMQAWGATARRLGADADAGAEAIAALAREQQQFNLTGNAPTMQALARLGVRVGKDVSVGDMLGQAQQIYRSAAPEQRQQIENTLSAQGASADLILMIKSEKDARAEYARSFAQASDENRKALDALADSLESMKAQAVSVATVLLDVLQPAVEWGAVKLGEFARDVSTFAGEVRDAGGGVDAFVDALTKRSDNVSEFVRGLEHAAMRFRQIGDVLSYVLDKVSTWATSKWLQFLSGGNGQNGKDVSAIANMARTGAQAVASWASSTWAGAVGAARDPGRGLPRNIENDTADGLPRNVENDRLGAKPSANAQQFMETLVTKHGLTVAQAAAVTSNWQGESSLDPTAYNPAGGGTGARGLGQWRGPRTEAFKRMYGVDPTKASVDEQINFMLTDPYERQLWDQVKRSGGDDAYRLGGEYSRRYEAHGNVAEDARRARNAQVLADSYGGSAQRSGTGQTTSAATVFNIQNVEVKANTPQDFVGGIQRVTGTQNHVGVMR